MADLPAIDVQQALQDELGKAEDTLATLRHSVKDVASGTVVGRDLVELGRQIEEADCTVRQIQARLRALDAIGVDKCAAHALVDRYVKTGAHIPVQLAGGDMLYCIPVRYDKNGTFVLLPIHIVPVI